MAARVMNRKSEPSTFDIDPSRDELDKEAIHLRRFRHILSLLVLLWLALAGVFWWQVLRSP